MTATNNSAHERGKITTSYTVTKIVSDSAHERGKITTSFTVKKVSDIPAGDGKIANIFLQCSYSITTSYTVKKG
jgi:hypothetical protein